MKKRLLKVAAVASVLGFTFIAFWMWRTRTRERDLGGGYAYVEFHGGHRYIVTQPDGIKRVGQQVLEYYVADNVITGKVRLSLRNDDVRAFILDKKSNTVTFVPPIKSLFEVIE